MKILFTCAYYVPEKAASIYLTEDLALGLSHAGHEVKIVTPVPTRGINDDIRTYYKKNHTESAADGSLIIKRFSLYREGKGTIGRAIRYFLCNIKHLYFGLTCKYDVLFVDSTPPTQGLVSAVIKLFRKKKVIYNAQDIFPDSLISSGISSSKGIAWKFGRLIERITYWSADTIIVISQSMKDNLLLKNVPDNKIKVVYNWVDVDKITPINRDENDLFEQYGISREDFNVVYAGNLGHAQNIDIILNVAKKLLDYNDIRFLIFGTGNEENRIRQKINDENISNIRLLPIQSADNVSKVYSLGDLCIVSCKRNFGGIAMPSKFANILSCGTPVIVSFDDNTDLQYLVENNNLGYFCAAENEDVFLEQVKNAYNSRAELQNRSSKIRDFAISHFSKKTGVKQYIDIIESLH